ncbi:MAG: PaaI family thioesterase [Gemmatimonadaceae bacterium]
MDQTSIDRTRTVTWRDPASGETAGMTLTGLEYLRAMARGEAPPPPLALMLGLSLDEIEEGRVVMTVVPEEFHYNPRGVVHGGLAATLFDSALGCAVQSLLPPAHAAPTQQLQINYIRPIRIETGKMFCSAQVIHKGKRSATAEGRLTDRDGKLYAHATGTFIITGPDDRKGR